MPSSLPTGDSGSKAVKDFGIGTYDAPLDSGSHGEDSEETEPAGPSLPEGGGYEGPFLEFWLSYPTEEALSGKHASVSLPGDYDRPPRSRRPADDTFDDVLPTSGPPAMGQDGDGDEDGEEGSKLPSGHWPAARADYYDTMTMGTAPSTTDIWPGGSSGAYVSQDAEDAEEEGAQLPGSSDNDTSMDDFLGALGNMWSGFVIEDQSVPHGFPSEDYREVWDGGGPSGGTVLSHIDTSNTASETDEDMRRTATDLQLVGDLSKEFVKEFGKKDLVRRHVLAFLQDKGLPQYLASDIIRCLKHRDKIVIADVMDQFPVKTASVPSRPVRSFSTMRDRFIQGEIDNISRPEVSSKFRRCAADLAHVIAGLEKLEG